MQLPRKEKTFFEFFFFFLHYVNLYSILNIFQKKMTVIADVFLNLLTLKDVVIQMTKESCFRRSFNK